MPKGGHARSGPAPDPTSARSDQRGLKFTALPAEGYRGDFPEWPLPRRRVMVWEVDGKARYQVEDGAASARVAEREASMWEWAWRTPQAAAWAKPSESWRLHSIAMWVRTYVVCESAEATAADKGSLHRFADDIGLTPAGLRVNGWAIAHDEVAERAAEKDAPPARKSARDRMQVLSGGAR